MLTVKTLDKNQDFDYEIGSCSSGRLKHLTAKMIGQRSVVRDMFLLILEGKGCHGMSGEPCFNLTSVDTLIYLVYKVMKWSQFIALLPVYIAVACKFYHKLVVI